MSEKNKALVRRLLEEVTNGGNLEVADELIAPEYARVDPRASGWRIASLRGPEAFKRLNVEIRNCFPDLHITVEEQIAEGDTVVTRWTCRGTHRGECMGIPPTGKLVTWSGITIHRLVNGKIVEAWIQADSLGVREQIGAGLK